jgi:hypothetical protein
MLSLRSTYGSARSTRSCEQANRIKAFAFTFNANNVGPTMYEINTMLISPISTERSVVAKYYEYHNCSPCGVFLSIFLPVLQLSDPNIPGICINLIKALKPSIGDNSMPFYCLVHQAGRLALLQSLHSSRNHWIKNLDHFIQVSNSVKTLSEM